MRGVLRLLFPHPRFADPLPGEGWFVGKGLDPFRMNKTQNRQDCNDETLDYFAALAMTGCRRRNGTSTARFAPSIIMTAFPIALFVKSS